MGDPHTCVQCLEDSDCTDAAPKCDPMTHMCICEAGMDKCSDSDDDGLSDGDENEIGTDPHDADTDDDGVKDGMESMPRQDSDNDGKVNALDPDSDNDGLDDGTEIGADCALMATDTTAGNCIPDADMGATKTDPLNPDTDGGSVHDGDEDSNHDGKVDMGERDPNNPADDVPMMDAGKPPPPPPPDAGPPPSNITEIAGGGCGVSGEGSAGATSVLVFAGVALLIRRRRR
jgi:MYXO-CTERM domain-containing protein